VDELLRSPWIQGGLGPLLAGIAAALVFYPMRLSGLAAAFGFFAAVYLTGQLEFEKRLFLLAAAAALLGAVALFLVAGRRVARGGRPAVRATVIATSLYLPVWLVLGGSFWLCGRGLLGVPEHDLAFYVGAFAIAWLAGLVAIYAPGGLGVREAVLVALLSSRIGAANALVLAAASRLIFVLVDGILAGVATAALRRGRPGLDAADPA